MSIEDNLKALGHGTSESGTEEENTSPPEVAESPASPATAPPEEN